MKGLHIIIFFMIFSQSLMAETLDKKTGDNIIELNNTLNDIDKMLGITVSVKANRAKLNIQYIKDKAKLISKYKRIKKKNDEINKYNSDAEWVYKQAHSKTVLKVISRDPEIQFTYYNKYQRALKKAKGSRNKLKVLKRYNARKFGIAVRSAIIKNNIVYVNVDLDKEIPKYYKVKVVKKNIYPSEKIKKIDNKISQLNKPLKLTLKIAYNFIKKEFKSIDKKLKKIDKNLLSSGLKYEDELKLKSEKIELSKRKKKLSKARLMLENLQEKSLNSKEVK